MTRLLNIRWQKNLWSRLTYPCLERCLKKVRGFKDHNRWSNWGFCCVECSKLVFTCLFQLPLAVWRLHQHLFLTLKTKTKVQLGINKCIYALMTTHKHNTWTPPAVRRLLGCILVLYLKFERARLVCLLQTLLHSHHLHCSRQVPAPSLKTKQRCLFVTHNQNQLLFTSLMYHVFLSSPLYG